MRKADYIDFSTLRKNFRKKKLIQPMSPDEFIDRLELYYEQNNKLNLYSLSLHFGMTAQRFTSNYLNSKDKELATLARMATNSIAAHALVNEEDYKRSLRFILARENTGKDFIELSEEMAQSETKVVFLPEKVITEKEDKNK